MSEHPETLTFTATQIDRLRDHLIQDDELERIAVAFCSESGDDTLLIEEFRLLADDQHEVQKPAACRLNLDSSENNHRRALGLCSSSSRFLLPLTPCCVLLVVTFCLDPWCERFANHSW